jgi:hypothetical protein
MRGTWTIARREIQSNRLALFGALILGFVAVALPYLPGISGGDRAEVRAAAALGIAIVYSVILVIGLGYASLGRDLAERRMGFWYSRPVTSAGIWAGKTLGGLATALCATLIVLLPASLTGIIRAIFSGEAISGAIAEKISEKLNFPTPNLEGWAFIAALLIGLVAVFALCQVLGVVLRSRSALLAVDVIAVLILAALVGYSGRRLYLAWAEGALRLGLTGLFLALTLALLVAGLAAVSGGRVEFSRAHRTASAALWTGASISVIAFATYSHWVLAVKPTDLATIDVLQASPRGNWVAITGFDVRRMGFTPNFVLNPSTGEFLRIGSVRWNWGSAVRFSETGARVAWTELERNSGEWRWQINWADLGPGRPVRHATTITFAGEPPRLVFSEDASRLATIRWGEISVFSLESGRVLSAVKLPAREFPRDWPDFPIWTEFRGSVLKVFREIPVEDHAERRAIEIFALDVDAKKLARTGQVESVSSTWPALQVSPDGRFLLLRESKGSSGLYDASTGTRVSGLAGEGSQQVAGTYLVDNRIVIGKSDGKIASLDLFTPIGAPLRHIELGIGSSVEAGGQPTARRIFVRVSRRKNNPYSGEILIVDVENGKATPLAKGRLFPFSNSNADTRPEPGSFAARLFVDSDWGTGGRMVELDPETGARRTIIPGR